jgi:hypothetical protein
MQRGYYKTWQIKIQSKRYKNLGKIKAKYDLRVIV